jgi:hypothetical protein
MLRWLLNHVSSAVLAVLVTGVAVALGTAAKHGQRWLVSQRVFATVLREIEHAGP